MDKTSNEYVSKMFENALNNTNQTTDPTSFTSISHTTTSKPFKKKWYNYIYESYIGTCVFLSLVIFLILLLFQPPLVKYSPKDETTVLLERPKINIIKVFIVTIISGVLMYIIPFVFSIFKKKKNQQAAHPHPTYQ